MISRAELLQSKEYWMVKIQNDLYAKVEDYMKENNINRTQMAKRLGVSKSYLSQVLNGDFNHKLSKLVEIALAIGIAPIMEFKYLEQYIQEEKTGINTINPNQKYLISFVVEPNEPVVKNSKKVVTVDSMLTDCPVTIRYSPLGKQ